MENKAKQLRSELKILIDRDTRFGPFLLILVSVVFPILEGILINVWTGAGMTGSAFPCLLVIGTIHLILSGILIWYEFQTKSPLRILADSADLADCNCRTQRELDRKSQTYRMFREVIDEMNAQVCASFASPTTFETAIKPIMKKLLDVFSEVVGVSSNKYTLEIYLCKDIFGSGTPERTLGEYRLVFFDSPIVQLADALKMGNVHPVCICAAAEHERMIGKVSDNPALFVSGQTAKVEPYFAQYATFRIPTQCRTGHLGYLAVTTRQIQPMADDILDTLSLVASIISSFHSRWYDCEHNKAIVRENQALKIQLAPLRAAKATPVTPHPKLEIVAATYGADDKLIDVSPLLQSKIVNGAIRITSNNTSLGGDPAPGVKKRLSVEYKLNGVTKSISVPENSILAIPT